MALGLIVVAVIAVGIYPPLLAFGEVTEAVAADP